LLICWLLIDIFKQSKKIVCHQMVWDIFDILGRRLWFI